jgi:hypothetical protein
MKIKYIIQKSSDKNTPGKWWIIILQFNFVRKAFYWPKMGYYEHYDISVCATELYKFYMATL